MESQGASQEEVQGYLDSYAQPSAQDAPATTAPKESMVSRLARYSDIVFGGGKIGEAIGTKIAPLITSPKARQFVDKTIPTAGELAGSALQSAALFTPLGRVAGGITAGAKALGLKTGVSALGKIGAGALGGGAFDVALNLQEGKMGAEAVTPGLGTAIGAAIPAIGVAGKVLTRLGERQAPRIINSLIKPLAKDFSYGKNPGRAVAEEKIIANNFDDLITKIHQARQKVGQSIGELGDKISTKAELTIRQSLAPLDVAISKAASQNNQTLLNRLQSVKRSLTDNLIPMADESGQIVIRSSGQKPLDNLTFKGVRDVLGEIGDMTQFTGNPSDDKLVNNTLKRIYGSIKETSLSYARKTNPSLAKQFEKSTEKYADLMSAEIAAKYRDKITERQALIGLSPQVAGIASGLITLVATGGSAAPAVLAGITGAVLDKLATTPAFKTRLAAILSQRTPQEMNIIFQKLPALRKLFPQGSPMSPGDRLLQTKLGQKVSSEIGGAVKDYVKNPKLGLSIEDVSKKASPLHAEALKYKTAEEFVGTSPFSQSKVKQVVYHGSPEKFEEFSLNFMGKQGRTEGSGIYFTDKKDIAQGYATARSETGGHLYEAYLDIKKPMSLEQHKILDSDKWMDDILEEILKRDREALGNYGGDINFIGKEKTKKIALDILRSNDTDVDLVSDLMNSGIRPSQEINDIFRNVTGYDGIITKWAAKKGDTPTNIFIALSPDQIKTKSQLTDIWKKAHGGFTKLGQKP